LHITDVSFVFTNKRGDLLDKSSVSKAFTSFLHKIGIFDKSFHCIRHTYVTYGIEAGVSTASMKLLAGHADIAITDHYTHIRRESLINTIEKIGDAVML
jgi:site-specific recombinase XerD